MRASASSLSNVFGSAGGIGTRATRGSGRSRSMNVGARKKAAIAAAAAGSAISQKRGRRAGASARSSWCRTRAARTEAVRGGSAERSGSRSIAATTAESSSWSARQRAHDGRCASASSRSRPSSEARGEQAHAAAQPQVGEDHGPASVSVSRMRWSARCRLLFTVPRLMPSVVAISSRLSSW